MDPTDPSHQNTPFRPRSSSNDRGGNRLQMQILNTRGAGGGIQTPPSASTMLRASPYSPFPFGLPIQSSSRSLLSPGSLEQQEGNNIEKGGVSNENVISGSGLHVFRGRVRAQDVYGGNNYFGVTISQ